MVSGEHLFRVTKGLMLIAGIWKLEMPGVSARYKKMYSIYGVVVQVAYIMTLASCLIKFCQLFGVDNDKAVECLSMLSIVCVLSVKGLSCQTEQVTSILRRTIDQVNAIFSSEDSHVKNMFYKYSRYNHWLNIFVTIYCFSLGLHLNIIGLVQYYQMTQQYGNETENMDRPQMTLNWYPFDPNEHYVFVLFYQLISVLWSDLLYSSVQTLFNTIMLQLTAQFKILQHDFKHFACDRLSGKPVSKQEAYRNMKRLIKKHQDLISYTEDFNSALKYPILLEYIVCSLMLASIFVQIISGKKMLFNVQYFLILTLQFSIFSWNANEIRTQSENISFALYESNWYEQSARTKKLMFIVVLRTKRPLSLNIGPFGPLTNDATVSRLKLAYSYVSLISNRKSVHEVSRLYMKLPHLLYRASSSAEHEVKIFAKNFLLSMNYFLEMFNILRWLIMASGSWHLEVEPIIQIPYKIYMWFFRFVNICCLLMLMAIVFDQIGADYGRAIATAGFVIANSCATIKMFLAANKKLTNLFRIIINDVATFREDDPEIEKFIRKYYKIVKKMAVCVVIFAYIVWLCTAFDILWGYASYKAVHPNATEKPEFLLYFKLPFSVQKHFNIALGIQIFLSLEYNTMMYSSLAIFTSPMVYSVIKLKILQHHFKHFHRFPREYDSDCDDNPVLRKQMAINNIKLLIKQHQNLIGFVKNLNEIIKNAILIEYTVSSLLMASVLLQLLNGNKFHVFIPYGTVIVSSLFTLSWVAEEVKTESGNIGNAIYESRWYTYDFEVKRLLYVVMIRAGRELSLDIGPFGPNNMSAFFSRMKLAYSYISLMSGNKV